MIIEIGKYYKTRGGAVRGPACIASGERVFPWNVGGYMYQPDGMFYGDQEHSFDLVEEVDPSITITNTPRDTAVPTEFVTAGGTLPSPTEVLADLHVQEQEAKAKTTKASLLDAAKATVADRGLNYGKPEDNFQRIAALWNVHLSNSDVIVDGSRALGPADVAQMMALMKIARLENDPSHLDSWTDLAGYAACGAEISA